MAEPANEKLLDSATRHQIRLQRLDNGIVAKIIRLLDETSLDIIARIQKLDPDADTLARLEQLLAEVQLINTHAYNRLREELNGELREFTAMETEFQAGQLNAALNQGTVVSLAIYAPSPEQVIVAAREEPFQGRLLREWYDSLETGQMQHIRDAVRQGYVQGENLQSIVGRVRGTSAKNFQDGAIAISQRNAEAVIRTALGHYAAKAQDMTIQANKHVIREIMWLSTLDGRTTRDICIPRSGKRYTLDHEPIGHNLPWGAGPGAIHWNAVCEGTLIETDEGLVTIDAISPGDRVRTHSGSFCRVLARRRKHSNGRIVRVIETESGRVLRATDDHPVLVGGVGWVFVGALEAGNNLLCNPEKFGEVKNIGRTICSDSKYGPSMTDQTAVSIERTMELVTTDIDFKGGFNTGYAEVDNSAVNRVLENPSIIEDQSALHYLFALSHVLKKFGSKRLCNLIALLEGDFSAKLILPLPFVSAALKFGLMNPLSYGFIKRWVIFMHSLGMSCMDFASFLRQTIGPVILTAGHNAEPFLNICYSLFSLVSNRYAIPDGKLGEASISQSMFSFEEPKGPSISDVSVGDKVIQCGFFHDPIISLKVQTFNGYLFDLEVEKDASYIANGVVVSNCRSYALPVTRRFDEMGLDIEEPAPGSQPFVAFRPVEVDGQPVPLPKPAAKMSVKEYSDALRQAGIRGQRLRDIERQFIGRVPGDTNYQTFLRRQDAGFQDEVLGATRGALFRRGGLKVTDFVNDRGRFLTIDELRAREPEAFKRAGLDEAA